jgi:HAE1 family hydrophobic/amphiphilic exporter-1
MSLCVSFTLTPMLCSRFLKLREGRGSKSGPIWRSIEGAYGWMLAWSLRHRWIIVLSAIGCLAVTPFLFSIVGFEFVPRDDQSELEVAVTMPEGYTLESAGKLFREIEGRLGGLRGVENVFSIIGDTTGRIGRGQGDVTAGTIYLRLTDLEKRQRTWYDPMFWCNGIRGKVENDNKFYTQFDVQDDARRIMKDYPDLRVAIQDVAIISASGFRQSMIDLTIRGPDLVKLQQYSEQIMNWMKNEKGFLDVDTSLSLRKPELRVNIDRERASDLGIPIQQIASTLTVLVGGEPVTKYKELDEQYDVWLRADLSHRAKPEEIGRLMIPSPKAGLVQLDSVARLDPAKGPANIDRFSMQRQVEVIANLEQTLPTGDAVEKITKYVKDMNLPADYRWEFIGKAKVLKESNQNFLIAFIVSFVFMYMILAAQFESFVHPITILLALPLTLPFALISLLLLRTPLDLFAMFGLFMLFGIVKKNGILQVDYTNVLRAKGLPREEAILQANHTRLRPILMTTVMLIAAMIPIALGRGAGSGSRASLAKVVLGGQTLSLLLTLLLTPVAYTIWDDAGRFFSRLFGGQKPPPAPERKVEQDYKQLPDKRYVRDESDHKKHREKLPAPTISRMETTPEHP